MIKCLVYLKLNNNIWLLLLFIIFIIDPMLFIVGIGLFILELESIILKSCLFILKLGVRNDNSLHILLVCS